VGLPGQAPLGYVQATVLPPHRAWIGYVLGSAHWGHGHGFAAVGAMLEHLRSRYGVTRFQASVEAANVRSIRLLERLGFLEATPQEAATLGMSRSERLYQRTLS
jgi:RimJ/RimL family protein N-acetyltransferase